MDSVFKYRLHILGLMFLTTLCLFWPGFIQSDSQVQYLQAVAQTYTDHHPPLMSFIWHYLDLVVPGEGLMFALQLSFLYIGLYFLLLSINVAAQGQDKVIASVLILLLPIFPQVLIYALNIVKDVQYAFSFLCVASVLAYYTLQARKPPLIVTICILLLMLYGAAVKYQGQFCVVVLSVWLACLFGNKLWQKIALGLALYVAIFVSIGAINSRLVPVQGKNYAWQYVKLYDLAAMSRELKIDLIPEFNRLPAYTFAKLQQRFQYPSVDPYIFSQDNILTITQDPEQMQALYKHWQKMLISHPIAYLKHRICNMAYALLSRPGYDYALNVFAKFPENKSYVLIKQIISAGFYVLMSHLLIVLLGVIYMGWGILNWRVTKAAHVLVGLSSLASIMVGVLFFMSMAGVPRYTYITIVLVHAAHPFAYLCYVARKKLFATPQLQSLVTQLQ